MKDIRMALGSRAREASMRIEEIRKFLIALKALTGEDFIFTLREDGSGAVEVPSPDPGRKLPFGTFAGGDDLQGYLNEALNGAVQSTIDQYEG
ncbi:hypothetical protein LCGC14_2220840 [marine sediment metagenome]|uniref:Uncharacterized protein n=1 Tax=marine sediment metagenome TaxID=412755 RepID=A0A0F9DB56_9ZZZZ